MATPAVAATALMAVPCSPFAATSSRSAASNRAARSAPVAADPSRGRGRVAGRAAGFTPRRRPARRWSRRSHARRPPTGSRCPCSGPSGAGWALHGRPGIDEEWSIELATVRFRRWLPATAAAPLRRAHARAGRQPVEELLHRAAIGLRHTDCLQVGIDRPGWAMRLSAATPAASNSRCRADPEVEVGQFGLPVRAPLAVLAV